MLQHGQILRRRGLRVLGGPGAGWWLGGRLGALGVKWLGLSVGGGVTLLGLSLLSAWLPALLAHRARPHWRWRQTVLCWLLLVLTGLIWLPLGWGGYLATLQAGVQLPAAFQNWLFNTRYDWLPVVVPVWGLTWLVSLKWLPSLAQQLHRPTNWRSYWRTGWHQSWWAVVKWLLMRLDVLIELVLLAGGLALLTWLAESVRPRLGYVAAILSLTVFQSWVGLMLAGGLTRRQPPTGLPHWRFWLNGVVCVFAMVGYGAWWLQPHNTAVPAIIAHRGVDGRDGVQNTTSALKRTVRRTHPAMVEMDIQPTADRHWVVMHDSTLWALAQRPGPVKQYRLDQLSGLPLRENGQCGRLSTFAQYLTAANRLDQPLLVEIKALGGAGQLMGPFADRYAQTLINRRGAVHSLDYQVIVRLKQRNSRLQVGFITPFYLADFSHSVADFYSLQGLTATREQVNAAHRAQRPVYFWTVDRPGDMQRLTAMGADGLITNHPGRLQRLQTLSNHYYFYQLINWLFSWL